MDILKEIKDRIEKIENDSFIIYHFDVDGVASASCIWRVLKKKYINAKFEPITNGWEDVVIDKIKKHNPKQIIFLDYTPERIKDKIKDYQVIIIDHHEVEKLPKSFDYFTSSIYERGFAISYLISKTVEKFYGFKCDWLGFLGSYWDKCLEKTEYWNENSYRDLMNKFLPFNLLVSFTKIKGSIKLLKIFNESDSIEDARKKVIESNDYKNAKKIFEEEKRNIKIEKDDGVKIIYLKTKFKHIRIYVDYFTFTEPGTYIFVLKEKGRTKFSFRSNKNILKIVKKIEDEIDDFSGGGHENACGGMLKDENEKIVIEKFLKYFRSYN